MNCFTFSLGLHFRQYGFGVLVLAGFSRVTLLGSAGGPASQLIYLEFTFPPNKNLDNHKILTDKRKGKKAFVRWKMFNWLAKGKKGE